MADAGIELRNNDTTPMEEVVDLLSFVFNRDHATSFELMLEIHRKGSAVVATFPKEKTAEVQARLESFLNGMDLPVSYVVIDDDPNLVSRPVDFEDLPDLDSFRAKKHVEKQNYTFWIQLLTAVLLVGVAFIAAMSLGLV